jgi:hypothetical protein
VKKPKEHADSVRDTGSGRRSWSILTAREALARPRPRAASPRGLGSERAAVEAS